MDDITIKEAKARYKKHHTSSAYALIRTRARSIAKLQGWKKCSICGYNKHIEIAHLKPIGEFSLNTRLSVVNRLENLLPLCPNCHWEFDNGLISIAGIKRKIKDKILCPCGASLSYYSSLCKDCHKQSVSIENSISKETLEKLIKTTPITKIAKKYNVSDSAVIKWCKKYNISRPGRGSWSGK